MRIIIQVKCSDDTRFFENKLYKTKSDSILINSPTVLDSNFLTFAISPHFFQNVQEKFKKFVYIDTPHVQESFSTINRLKMPTATEERIENVGKILNDSARPMKERFRALFTLKNIKGELAIKFIEQAFGDDSDLLKHELAYCLGQMQDPAAIPVLIKVLEDVSQVPMVRHEAGELDDDSSAGFAHSTLILIF